MKDAAKSVALVVIRSLVEKGLNVNQIGDLHASQSNEVWRLNVGRMNVTMAHKPTGELFTFSLHDLVRECSTKQLSLF